MVESLLPHRGEALFLREVVTHDQGSLTALASVPDRSAYADAGAVDALLAIEIAAQAAAAHAGLQRSDARESPGTGFLVGIKTLDILAPSFLAEQKIEVRIRLLGRAQQLASWSFELGDPRSVIARGELSVWSGTAT